MWKKTIRSNRRAVYSAHARQWYNACMKGTTLVLLSLFLVAPLLASAQEGLGIVDELVVSLSPERPGANETVTMSVESYIADLAGAEMRYLVNGELQRRGVGEKEFRFRTGAPGSATEVAVVVLLPDGRTLSKRFTLRPADVLLFWQTVSYTPPFYRGKALFPFQGTVTVAAVPLFKRASGEPYDARELVYTWKEDGKVIGNSSGYGKSLFVFRGGVPMRRKTVSVDVNTTDQSVLASASLEIDPVAPRLLLYENHPLYGIRFNHALASPYALDNDEVRLTAVPFFFEAPARASRAVLYDWSANYGALPNEKGPDITLRRVSGRGGEATVSLSARHETQSFQGDETALTIRFSEKPLVGAAAAP